MTARMDSHTTADLSNLDYASYTVPAETAPQLSEFYDVSDSLSNSASSEVSALSQDSNMSQIDLREKSTRAEYPDYSNQTSEPLPALISPFSQLQARRILSAPDWEPIKDHFAISAR